MFPAIAGFKIKARENFNHRNILNISRIKIRTQRRDWAKWDVFQGSQKASFSTSRTLSGGMTVPPACPTRNAGTFPPAHR